MNYPYVAISNDLHEYSKYKISKLIRNMNLIKSDNGNTFEPESKLKAREILGLFLQTITLIKITSKNLSFGSDIDNGDGTIGVMNSQDSNEGRLYEQVFVYSYINDNTKLQKILEDRIDKKCNDQLHNYRGRDLIALINKEGLIDKRKLYEKYKSNNAFKLISVIGKLNNISRSFLNSIIKNDEGTIGDFKIIFNDDYSDWEIEYIPFSFIKNL